MKRLYFTDRGPIEVNEKGEPFGVQTSREGINNILLIKEATHVVYNRGGKHVELDAYEGDIVITFWESSYENPMIIVNSKDWENNILGYEAKEQKAKEEWAKKQAESDSKDKA